MTRREFEHYIPSAVMPDEALFERISEYVDEGKAEVRELVGEQLYATREEWSRELVTLSKRMAYLRAYQLVIPHLDLVLTESGFGVVSNQNVAPASAERVERLREQVGASLDDTIDEILEELRGNVKWVETLPAMETFRSLVWNGRQQLAYFGEPNGHRTALATLRPKISAAEARVQHCISPEFYQELCDAVRLRAATVEQNTAIHKILMTIGADVTGDGAMARFHVKNLVEWLDGNIRIFPTYANSTAYAANTFEPYRNEKDDTTYFFG